MSFLKADSVGPIKILLLFIPECHSKLINVS